MTIRESRATVSPSIPTISPETPTVVRVSADVYGIVTGEGIVGYVHQAGRVYVALSGARYHRAVEVGQALSWDEALTIVRRSSYSAAA